MTSSIFSCLGADPHKENFEPLFFREHDCCVDEEEEDEGYIPGTTPLNMAATPEVGSVFVINLNVLLWSHITQLTNIATVLSHT